jgi:hypothetical protein
MEKNESLIREFVGTCHAGANFLSRSHKEGAVYGTYVLVKEKVYDVQDKLK